MKINPSTIVEGVFQNVIYSPKGEIEGVLLHVEGAPLHVAIDKHLVDAAAAFDGLTHGLSVKLEATPRALSSKGEPEHPVYNFGRVLKIDGSAPAKQKIKTGPAYQGTVVRFNYALHGEANGVVLDSGDFIHTRPDGFKKLGLQIGSKVQADGNAHRTVDNSGWAVEATTVNGKAIKPH